MSTRPTPFGLFAGCAIGSLDKFTYIKNTKPELNSRHTRLDMNYMVALSQALSKKKKIASQLLFYPNSSKYQSGNKLRYIEYYYVDSKRRHQIAEVDYINILGQILNKAKHGAHLDELNSLLLSNNISTDDARGYLEELIDNQLLICELEPSVSGPEFMNHILTILHKINGAEEEIKFLVTIQQHLKELDKRLGNCRLPLDRTAYFSKTLSLLRHS